MNGNVVDFPTYECSHGDTTHPTLLLPLKTTKMGSTADGDQDDGDLSLKHNICNFSLFFMIILIIYLFEEKKDCGFPSYVQCIYVSCMMHVPVPFMVKEGPI